MIKMSIKHFMNLQQRKMSSYSINGGYSKINYFADQTHLKVNYNEVNFLD